MKQFLSAFHFFGSGHATSRCCNVALFKCVKPLFVLLMLTFTANAQNGYIYIHSKTLDENSSPDIAYSISGGSTTVPGFALNDNPTQIAAIDIGSTSNGRLYAVGFNNNLYYRAAGSTAWVNTGVTGVTKVDGGEGDVAFIILGGRIHSYPGSGSSTTILYASTNAVDVSSGWNGTSNLYSVLTDGTVYKYSTGTTWAAYYNPSSDIVALDVVPSTSGDIVCGAAETTVYRITAASTATNIGRPVTSHEIRDIGVNAAGEAFVTMENELVYKYSGTGAVWSAAELTANGGQRITGGLGNQMWATLRLFQAGTPYNNIWSRSLRGSEIWWLDDERVRTTPTNGNSNFISVAPGTYTITETVPGGWDLQNIELYDPTSNSNFDLDNSTATIVVGANEVVHVVFQTGLVNPFLMTNNCTQIYTETFGTGAPGTFGAQTVGQTSYHYLNTSVGGEDGHYKLVSLGSDFNSWGSTLQDHTSGDGNTGRMYAVNAAYDRGEFFRRRFEGVVPGARYNFGAWVANLTNATVRPNVGFLVIDPVTKTILAQNTTGDITSTRTWAQYNLSFIATTSTIDLVLINNNIGGTGNDLAIDDITFQLVPPPSPIVASSTGISCSGTAGTITIIAPLGESIQYSVNGIDFQDSPTFTGLSQGTYNIIARYKNTVNCGLNLSVTVGVGICGNIFNDANGLNGTPLNTVDGVPIQTASGSQLYAKLFSSTGTFIATVPVNASGEYSFPSVPGNATYQVTISTSSATTGSTLANSVGLPAGWVNTGEFLGSGAGSDGSVNGILSVPVATSPINSANFGIEQTPETAIRVLPTQPNPGGTNSVVIPPAAFSTSSGGNPNTSDPSPGGIITGMVITNSTGIDAIIVDGVSYANAAAVRTAYPNGIPTNAAGEPTVPIRINPTATGATTAPVLNIAAVDEAGKQDPTPGSISIPFSAGAVVISGTIWNDADGSAVKNGAEPFTNASGLFANLVNAAGDVVASVPVDPTTGAYSFNAASGLAYKVILTTSSQTGATGLTTSTVPADWTLTGTNLNGTASTTNKTGVIDLGTVSANRTNQNFGIQEQPVAGNGTNTAVNLPGQITVPLNTFTNGNNSSDPAPGNVASIIITGLPSGASSININGTLYGAGGIAFPPAGVTISTDANGLPVAGTTITVDPTASGVTSVSIPFVVVDNANVRSNNTGAEGTAVLNLTAAPVSISGSVWNDANGSAVKDGAEPFTNASGLFANLVNAAGDVVASVPVDPTTGAYSFSAASGLAYKIILTTSSQTGATGLTTSTVPADWTLTGTNLNGTASTTNKTGVIDLGTVSANLTNQNFGIQEQPVAGNGTNTAVNLPGQITVPLNTFTNGNNSSDPAPGNVASIIITGLPSGASSININGTLYGTGGITFPPAGVTISTDANGLPVAGTTITVDPTADGVTSVNIPFVVVDNANVRSNNTGVEGTAVLNLTAAPVSISGSVWNDSNGSAIKDGAEPFTNASGLFANLVTPAGVVLQSVAIDPVTGLYNFANVPASTTYNVILTKDDKTGVTDLTASDLPLGWINTGVNIDGTPNTGNTSGVISVNAGIVSVANQNFGIEGTPTADPVTLTDVPNVTFSTTEPTGFPEISGFQTALLNNPNLAPLSGNDPEDCPTTKCSTGSTFVIETIKSANTKLYYDFGGSTGISEIVPGTATATITNFDPSKMVVYGANGSGGATDPLEFTYRLQDAAGAVSPPATYSIAMGPALPVTLTSFTVRKGEGFTARIDWATTAETNSEKFDVERSTDGKVWNRIATVAAKGQSSQIVRYHYTHNDPVTGENLYRLKMVDADATYTYSRVVSLQLGEVAGQVKTFVYPNPSSGIIQLGAADLSKVSKVEIVDINGKVVYTTKTISADGTVNSTMLANGNYVIKTSFIDGRVDFSKLVVRR